MPVHDYSDAPIPWPRRKGPFGSRPLILFGQLARAVRTESAQAVMHWWGVSATTIRTWRGKYRVGRNNPGTARLYREMARVQLTPAVRKRAWANSLASRAAAEAARRQRGLPQHPTFEQLARAWHRLNEPRWTTAHGWYVLRTLEPAFQAFGDVRASALKPKSVLQMLRSVEGCGTIYTARSLRARISAIYAYAIAEGAAETDPAAPLLHAMAPAPRPVERAAVLTLDEARQVLAAVEAGAAPASVRIAHRLIALTALRPHELMGGRWDEMHDLDTPQACWLVPAARMKMGLQHIVPLSRQAVAALDELRSLTGQMPWLFPDRLGRARPMTARVLREAIHATEWSGKHTPHGWRATVSTLLNDRFPADELVIELMLAHQPRNSVARVYNRAKHLPRRRERAQDWADMVMPLTSTD